jgi:triacylglycerol esterase/lipase EstA (alpha/beta hydrolase family)
MASDVESRRLQRARRNEGLCVLAHAAIYPFGFRRSRHRTPRSADRRTLVLVHGLGANRSSFFALQAYLRLSGFRDQLATSYRPRGSIEALALQLKRTIDDRVRGGRIDVIAHSMGGLGPRAATRSGELRHPPPQRLAAAAWAPHHLHRRRPRRAGPAR